MKNYLEYQREYRKRVNNKVTKKYERTINGFLVRKYRNMKSRVTGIQKVKYHLYKDKDLLPKEDFYSWAKLDKSFNNLFKEWEKSNYQMKLCPSIDRINPSQGYILNNMQWVTHSENSRRTTKNKNL